MASATPLTIEASDDMEQAKIFRWKMVFTAGMGFFTDAYDLFIIGVVTTILAPIWHLSITQVAVLNGAALAAAAFGAILFGTLSDKFGRKKMYGFEVLILFIGAILSATSMSFTWLLISRFIVGFGIGGDYPSSAVVASENAGRKNRGYIVLLVFAMQALGLLWGPVFASLLMWTHLSSDVIWRILIGFGAIPSASVFYLRRRIEESKFYKLSKQAQAAPFEVSRVISDLTGHEDKLNRIPYQKQSLRHKRWLKLLLGTAGSWFLLDVAFYGNGISSTMIIRQLQPQSTLLSHTLISAALFLCFAVPGYVLAAKYVDKIGRRRLQNLGFFMMALCYGIIYFFPHITTILMPFLLLFGLSFFFTNFGPNTTTFLIPSEVYPTSIRAKAHGVSAAIGKVGAFVGAFFLPLVLKHEGLSNTLGWMALVCVAGILTTLILPEMKQLSLHETER